LYHSIRLYGAALGPALLLLSCGEIEKSAGPLAVEEKSAQLAKAELLRAEVRMAAGELRVEGGLKREIKAKLQFNKGGMEPRFQFDDSSFRARLLLDHEEKSLNLGGDNRNSWELRLPDDVPTDLDIKMGAGETHLRLGAVDLRSVKFHIGAGSVVADFRGTPRRDYEIEINGGVGDCEVALPRGVGLRVEARGGIGSIDISGLEKRGDVWENEAFGRPGVKVRLNARGGIGRIQVRAE
jgi:hypothetical protein